MPNSMKLPAPESNAPPNPQDGSFPGSTPPPRKSPRKVWMVLGIVVLLCVLGGTLLALGVGFVVNNYGQSHVTDLYYSAIKAQDYATAYTYLGANVKAGLSQESFTHTAQQQDATEGRVNRFGFTTLPTGDPATVTLTVTRTTGVSYTVNLELRQEGGAWKITAFNRV